MWLQGTTSSRYRRVWAAYHRGHFLAWLTSISMVRRKENAFPCLKWLDDVHMDVWGDCCRQERVYLMKTPMPFWQWWKPPHCTSCLSLVCPTCTSFFIKRFKPNRCFLFTMTSFSRQRYYDDISRIETKSDKVSPGNVESWVLVQFLQE